MSILPLIKHMLFLQVFTLVLLLYPLQSLLLRMAAFGVIIYVACSALHCPTGIVPMDYGMGTGIVAQIATSIHFMFLTNPLDSFRHERDKVSPREMPFLQRVRWTLDYFVFPRGVGWNWQVPNVPPRPDSDRRSFLLSRVKYCICCLLALDIGTTYAQYNPIYASAGTPDAFPVTAQGPLMCVINSLFAGCTIIAWLNLQHTIVAIFAVATHFAEPEDWPELFGRWKESTSLRKFWGQTWHQMLRRHLGTLSHSFARGIGLRPGSLASAYMQLYIAFILSGLHHAAGDFLVHPSLVGISLPFFVYQAVGITLEEAVLSVVSSARLVVGPVLAKTLGRVWVLTWLAVTVPSFLSAQVRTGVLTAVVLQGISPCTWLVEYVQRGTGVVVADLFPLPRHA